MIPLAKVATDHLTEMNNKDKYKEDEIERFESMYPGIKIIRDYYETEKELESDWNDFWESPYSIRVLANDRSIVLFGMRNEEQYKIQKNKFLLKDIDNHTYAEYVPANESADPDRSNAARDYMNNGGYPLVTIDCEDMKELNQQWRRYLEQGEDKKAKSNSQSISFFGCPVEEVYQKAIKKFLIQDIKDGDSEIDDSIIGEGTVVFSDKLEKLVISERANDINGVESCFLEYQDRYPIGNGYENMTPWEVLDIFGRSVCENSELFNNLYAKFLGIKPTRLLGEHVVTLLLDENCNPDKLLECGFNPHMNIRADRVNSIIKENMNYQFINLSETEESGLDDLNTGIAVMVINELDKDNRETTRDLPKVLVTTSFDSPIWHGLNYGNLYYTLNVVDHIAKFNKPSVSVFFLPVSIDNLPPKLTMFADNEIERVTSALNRGCPDIANKHLFVANLLNSILYSPENNNDITLTLNRHFDGSKDTVVQVLDHVGNRISYKRIRQALNKINLVKECVDKTPSISQYFVEGMSYPTYPSEILSISESEDKTTWRQFRELFGED